MANKTDVYHGTYPVRRIGKEEMGIHLPAGSVGDFAIYEDEDGNYYLEKAGEKKKG